MFDRQKIQEHLRYMEEASDQELKERKSLYEEALSLLPKNNDVRKDIAFLHRKLMEEQAARLCIKKRVSVRETR